MTDDRVAMPGSDAGAKDETPSIQERFYPTLTCFGCGHANAKGLRLRSFEAADAVMARFQPWPEHDNGLGFLNGGIISTVLDCHSAAAVVAEADRRGYIVEGGPVLPFVTAGLDVRFLRPAPLDEACELRAVIAAAGPDAMTVDVSLWWDGKPRAEASALWKRWRPR